MKRVFVSYARKEKARILPVIHGLDVENFSVFWDNKILVNEEWQERLDDEIAQSDCIIVLWSRLSAKRPQVLREIELASKLNKQIVHCLIDQNVDLPKQYEKINMANLLFWTGGNYNDPHWRQVITIANGEEKSAPSIVDLIAPSTDQLSSNNQKSIQFSDFTSMTKELRSYLRKGYRIEHIAPNKIVLLRKAFFLEICVSKFMSYFTSGPDIEHLVERSKEDRLVVLEL